MQATEISSQLRNNATNSTHFPFLIHMVIDHSCMKEKAGAACNNTVISLFKGRLHHTAIIQTLESNLIHQDHFHAELKRKNVFYLQGKNLLVPLFSVEKLHNPAQTLTNTLHHTHAPVSSQDKCYSNPVSDLLPWLDKWFQDECVKRVDTYQAPEPCK